MSLAPCGECTVGECDRCPTCRRFEEISVTRGTVAAMSRLVQGQSSCNVAGCQCGTSTAPLHMRATSYPASFDLENVVPLDADSAQAMQSWAEAILWMTDTDSGTWTR